MIVEDLKLEFQIAKHENVFPILELYQKSLGSSMIDSLFLDYRKLSKAIEKKDSLWVVAKQQGQIVALLSSLVDFKNGVCKVTHMIVDPNVFYPEKVLEKTLKFFLNYITSSSQPIDVVYTTTFSMTMDQQQITLQEGFKILGVFPNALGGDQSKLNGLTAFYYDGVLEQKRYKKFSLHPVVGPFFEIARKQCGLPSLSLEPVNYSQIENSFESFPQLELIDAAQFVKSKFDRLQERHSQVLQFYPFHTPNALITDPNQQIEIFVKIDPQQRWAVIIGERVELAVNPVELYRQTLKILKDNHVSYVEIINDAADRSGIECIVQAGFTPSAYFPAFKRQGNLRRDFVVFGKSFEYLCQPSKQTFGVYLDYYHQFFEIAGNDYLGKRI